MGGLLSRRFSIVALIAGILAAPGGIAADESGALAPVEYARFAEAARLLAAYGDAASPGFGRWLAREGVAFVVAHDSRAYLVASTEPHGRPLSARVERELPDLFRPEPTPEKSGFLAWSADWRAFSDRFVQPGRLIKGKVLPRPFLGRRIFAIRSLAGMNDDDRLAQLPEGTAPHTTEYWISLFVHEVFHLYQHELAGASARPSVPLPCLPLIESIAVLEASTDNASCARIYLSAAAKEFQLLRKAFAGAEPDRPVPKLREYLDQRAERERRFRSCMREDAKGSALHAALGINELNEGEADYFALRVLFSASLEKPRRLKEHTRALAKDGRFYRYASLRRYAGENAFDRLLLSFASLDGSGRDRVTNPLLAPDERRAFAPPSPMAALYGLGALEEALIRKLGSQRGLAVQSGKRAMAESVLEPFARLPVSFPDARRDRVAAAQAN